MAKGKYLRIKKLSAGQKVGRVLLVIILILLLLFGALFAFVWSKLGLINYDDGSLKETIPPITSAAPTDGVLPTDVSEPDPTTAAETVPLETVDMGGLTMAEAPSYSQGELFKDKNVMNILLVGSDEDLLDNGYSNNYRGDLNIMVSINKADQTVKLVSFSRGIAIKMLDGPYKGKYEWLTNAHRWAGTEAVLQEFEESFKIELNRYVHVNIRNAASIIDAIGGIEIELTSKEATSLNKVLHKNIYTEGISHLDGWSAVKYARIRDIDDDWHRIQRQRKCILAVVDKLKGSDFATLNKLCDTVLPMIRTNLTKLEIAELILYSPKFLNSEFDQMTIPIENSYGGMNVVSGAGGWALDYGKNNVALHEFLFGTDGENVN